MSRAIITISGNDRRNFLQGLITNDIHKLDSEDVIYTLMLTPQGKFLHDFYIREEGDILLLDCYAPKAEELFKRLSMYKLRADVVITLRDIDVSHPGQSVSHPGQSSSHPGLDPGSPSISNDPRPLGYIDLIQDKSFPLEFGLDYLGAISFTKGCYVGQELTARTKHRGVVRKKLYIIKASFDLSLVEYGAELISEGKKIGSFCSGIGTIGKALIRVEDYSGNEPVTLSDKQVQITVADWYA